MPIHRGEAEGERDEIRQLAVLDQPVERGEKVRLRRRVLGVCRDEVVSAMLVPAWRILGSVLNEIPPDLPERLRRSALGERGDWIPGGARMYLNMLAEESATRLAVLKAEADRSAGGDEAVRVFLNTSAAVIRWWNLNRYCGTGQKGVAFRCEYVEPALHEPFRRWIARNAEVLRGRRSELESGLRATGLLPNENVRPTVEDLLGK